MLFHHWKIIPAAIIAICVSSILESGISFARMQESTRNLSSANQNRESKFLSSGEVDHWVIDAEQNEVIIANLTTTQFDGVLGLSVGEDEKEKVLFSVDQKGSNSRFRHRIERSGKYRIRVHGFQFKGGGNYQLNVERIKCQPIKVGETISARFDSNGRASFFFDAEPGQNLVASGNYHPRVVDPQGDNLAANWGNNFLTNRNGEYVVSLRGGRHSPFVFTLRPALLDTLQLGNQIETETQKDSLNIWEIDGKPGQFQVITVTRSPNHQSRLIARPRIDANEKRLDNRDPQKGIAFLPTSNKGKSTTFAAFFNSKGKYQLQTLSHEPSLVRISVSEPTRKISDQSGFTGRISVGGAAYYGFEARQGDLVKFNLGSENFDSQLTLYDQAGNRLAANDDFNLSTNSEISHLVRHSGYYRFQISSVGNGGGGEFSGKFTEIQKRKIKIGKTESGSIDKVKTEYWSFDAKRGKQILVNVQSSQFYPAIRVFDSRGYVLANNRPGIGKSSMVPVEVRDGPITIWVTGNKKGDYRIRILDADWK